jgi:hypothetical protein
VSPAGTRDAERARTYDAEEAAFGGTRAAEPVAWAELEAYAGALAAVLARAGLDPGPFVLRRGRAGSGRSSALVRPGGPAEVRVAPDDAAPATVTHELAHLLAPGEGHGAAFRAAHVAVAGVGLGRRGATVLAEEYRRAGLALGRVPGVGGSPRTDLPGWGLLVALDPTVRTAGPVS